MSSRLVRVFISSTFRDFLAERDELVKKVFPELRLRCRERQVELLEVDLRWGITEEQSRRGETLAICLQEIDRCRPSSPVFFIGFLGERYGWIPEADFYQRDVLENPDLDWIQEHIGGRSVTELEILHGVLRNPQMADRAFFYFREDGYEKRHWDSIHAAYPDLQPEAFTNASEVDQAGADEKQRDLKSRICGSGLQHNPRTYETPEDVGAMVLEDLWALIDAAYPATEVPDEWERQRIEHAVFARSRTKGYVSRSELFEKIDAVFKQDGPAVKVVTGSSGGGKSALIAAWMETSEERLPERCFVHYIGGTPESGTATGLVRRLMQTIRRWGVVDKAVPDDLGEAVRLLPKWLEAAAAGRSDGVLLVLDALNQIEAPSDRSLWWLPSVLPPGVRLIASTLPGLAEEALRKRGWMGTENVVEVEPLSTAERTEIIHRYLNRFTKKLEQPVVQRLAGAPQTGNALFLKVVLDELRSRASHESLRSMVERMLEAKDPVELFTQVLKGLEEFDRDRPNLVREALGYLHAARRGLTESELLQLLSDHPEPATNPLPHRIWAPVYLALEESLVSRNGRLGFFHDYLREAVEHEYLDEESERIRIHARFGEVALAWKTQRFSPSLRTYGLAFGAYHLRRGGDHEKLWSLLGEESYRDAQRAEFNRVDEAVESLREGVERYAERNGTTGEDDTRLCWLTLRCGEVAREARTQLGEVFEAFRTGPQESMERVESALERLSILDDDRFVDACLLLLYLECERPRERRSVGFESRCDRVLEKLTARLAELPRILGCPRWIAKSLVENLPLKKGRHLFLKQMGISKGNSICEVDERPENYLEVYVEVLCRSATTRSKIRSALSAIRRMDDRKKQRNAFLELAIRSDAVEKKGAEAYAREALENYPTFKTVEETAEVVQKLLSAGCVGLARNVLAASIRRARKKRAALQIPDFAVLARMLRTGCFEKISNKLAVAAYQKANELAQESDGSGGAKTAKEEILAYLAAAAVMRELEQIEKHRFLTHRAFEIINRVRFDFSELATLAQRAQELGEWDFSNAVLEKTGETLLDFKSDLAGEARVAGECAALGWWEKSISVLEKMPLGLIKIEPTDEWEEHLSEERGGSFINYREQTAADIFVSLHKAENFEAASKLAKREHLADQPRWIRKLQEIAEWHADRGEKMAAAKSFVEALSSYPKSLGVSSAPCSEGIILWSAGRAREAVARVAGAFPEDSIVRGRGPDWVDNFSRGEFSAVNWVGYRAVTDGRRDLLSQIARTFEKPQQETCLLAMESLLDEGNFYSAVSLLKKLADPSPGLALLGVHKDLISANRDEQGMQWDELMMEFYDDDKIQARMGLSAETGLMAHHFRALRLAKKGQLRAAMNEGEIGIQKFDLEHFTVEVEKRLALQQRFRAATKFANLSESLETRFSAFVAIAQTAHALGESRCTKQTLRRALSFYLPEKYSGIDGAVKLATLYSEVGWVSGAVRVLDKGIACHPPKRRRQTNTGAEWATNFLCEAGHHKAAERWAERIISPVERLRQLSRISIGALDAGKQRLARRIARKASVSIRGIRNIDGLLDLADVLIQAGDSERAAEIGRQILRLGKADFDLLKVAHEKLDQDCVKRLAHAAAVFAQTGATALFQEITQQLGRFLTIQLREFSSASPQDELALLRVIGSFKQASIAVSPALLREFQEITIRRIELLGDRGMLYQWIAELSAPGMEGLRQMIGLQAIRTSHEKILRFLDEADFEELEHFLYRWTSSLGELLHHLEPEGPILDALRRLDGVHRSLSKDAGSVLLHHLIGAMRTGIGLVQIQDPSKFERTQRWIRALQTVNPASTDWGRTLCLLLTASHALCGNLQQTRSMTERLPQLGIDLARSSFVPRRCRIADGESLTVQISGTTALIFKFCPEGDFWMDGFPGQTGGQRNPNPSWVRITQKFWIAEMPVTRGFWDELYSDSRQNLSPSELEKSRLIRWEEAERLVQSLTRRFAPKGWRFAVPAEAQWEYATKLEGSAMQGTHPEWCCDLFLSSLPAGEDPGITLDEKRLPKINDLRWILTRKVLRHWDTGSGQSDLQQQHARSCAGDRPQALRLVLVQKQSGKEDRRNAEINQTRLAEHLAQSGENKFAAAIFRRQLSSQIRQFGERHQAPLELMRKLGRCVIKASSNGFGSDNLFKAERLLRSALRGFIEVEGPDHPSTLGCMGDLGRILVEHLHDLGGGPWSMRRKIELARQSRCRPPWAVGIRVFDSSAPIKERLGDEAESLLRGALKGMEETLGADHRDTKETLITLERLLEMKREPGWLV